MASHLGLATRAPSLSVAIAALVGLVGCAPPAPHQLAPPTDVSPALAADACDAPPPTVDTIPGMPPRPLRLLTGGVVKAGDFTFDMWLYCDETLSPSGEGASYSDVAGLGIHLVWRYSGPELLGGTEYSFGARDFAIAAGGDGGPLTPGSMASYSGGVHSPGGALGKAVASGDLVTITTKVRAGQLEQSADFSFAFQQGIGGLKLGAYALEPSS
jgi:hypothetical protein